MTSHPGLGFSNFPEGVFAVLSEGVGGGVWLLQLVSKCPKRTVIPTSRTVLEAMEDGQIAEFHGGIGGQSQQQVGGRGLQRCSEVGL